MYGLVVGQLVKREIQSAEHTHTTTCKTILSIYTLIKAYIKLFKIIDIYVHGAPHQRLEFVTVIKVLTHLPVDCLFVYVQTGVSVS